MLAVVNYYKLGGLQYKNIFPHDFEDYKVPLCSECFRKELLLDSTRLLVLTGKPWSSDPISVSLSIVMISPVAVLSLGPHFPFIRHQ